MSELGLVLLKDSMCCSTWLWGLLHVPCSAMMSSAFWASLT